LSTDEFDAIFAGKQPAKPSFTARLRRVDPGAAEPSEDAAGSGLYKPYGAMPAGTCEGCDVQRWVDHTQIAEGIEFQYRFLMQVGYVGEEQIKLFLPDCIVVIEGKHLRDLRKRMARRQVSFIQQYSALVWPEPPPGEPIIESIAVVRPEPVSTYPRNR
jgi:hypothetical protein